MVNVSLRNAAPADKTLVIGFDYEHDKDEHVKLNRAEKIAKAIAHEECYIVVADHLEVGFIIFDYRFFDQGWIELMIIDQSYRGKGIGVKAIDLLKDLCESRKIFTSTNSSNLQMQKALVKAGFTFSGKLIGLDEGDPELFYFRVIRFDY
jgi:RimJ/RimL family protein N-acetyltransferase